MSALGDTRAAGDIVWLGGHAARDAATVGGKAAPLARLAEAFRVPPGFYVTTGAHARCGSGATRDGRLPDDLSAAIADAYAHLGEPTVAVRSSAADEDGAQASFAGQYETYLGVMGVPAVLDAVLRCWAATASDRALAYRSGRRAGGAAGGVAVLVQRLVVADVSAVAFTVDPVTGDPQAVHVEAAWGFGESLVGGTVTPDAYVVRKSDLAVVDRRIADKHRMSVLDDGGVREVDVPRFLRARPSLDDVQTVQIARLALDLEREAGRAVDVECALSDNVVHLLQCRPVTTSPRRP